MLKIINELGLFFEDCYREISVREYSRDMKMSPPTASKILKQYAREGLLKMKEDRGFILFRANRESKVLMDLSRIYWREKLKNLVEYVKGAMHPDSVVLFGSLAKLEVNERSDIDLVVFSKFKKNIDIKNFEKRLDKEVQLFVFESLDKVNKELRANIRRGVVLDGILG